MKTFVIYLFRHGQTTYNRDEKFTGLENPALTHLGIKQAKTVAKKLKNVKFGIAVRTHLLRSKQTLKEVLKYHPKVKTIQDDRMIERDYGDLDGTTHQEFIKKIGKRLYKLEVEGDLIHDLSKKQRAKIEKILGTEEYEAIHRGYNIRPPNGESFADVEFRVSSFVKDLKKLIKKHQTNVAISAHGNSIRLFRKIMEKATIKQACSWTIPYDHIYKYKIRV